MFSFMYEDPDEISTILPDRLYIGSAEAAKHKAALERLKVKFIISIGDPDDVYVIHEGFEYHRINMLDKTHQGILTHAALDQIVDLMVDHPGGILVHCYAGRSRSAAVVIAYMIRVHKMRYVDAHGFVKARRRYIKPNSEFVKVLAGWVPGWVPAQPAPSPSGSTAE